jgi:hypothetical protein
MQLFMSSASCCLADQEHRSAVSLGIKRFGKDNNILVQMDMAIKRIRVQAGCMQLINLAGNHSCRSNIYLNRRAYADLKHRRGNKLVRVNGA